MTLRFLSLWCDLILDIYKDFGFEDVIAIQILADAARSARIGTDDAIGTNPKERFEERARSDGFAL